MANKVLFTSDLHGNTVQYEKLVKHAVEISADYIILGGDIAPKGNLDYISCQRKFLENDFRRYFARIRRELPDSRAFIMMGNDDCAANLDIIEKDDGNLFQIIHGKRFNLTEDFDIVGYSNVPISPFGIKDWEKFDLTKINPLLKKQYKERQLRNYSYGGYLSTKNGWKDHTIPYDLALTDSIQKDLSDKLYQKDPKKTILVSHCPPNETEIDQIISFNHVGSFAIKEFIEKHQPHVTLHGHIHESVHVSGTFLQKIGDTISMSSGNHNIGETLHCIVFDLYKPQEAKRITL